MNSTAHKTTIEFDDRTVRHFMIASIIWGIVGMLVGVIAATQLSSWQMNGEVPRSDHLRRDQGGRHRRSSPSAASARCTPTRSSSPSSAT